MIQSSLLSITLAHPPVGHLLCPISAPCVRNFSHFSGGIANHSHAIRMLMYWKRFDDALVLQAFDCLLRKIFLIAAVGQALLGFARHELAFLAQSRHARSISSRALWIGTRGKRPETLLQLCDEALQMPPTNRNIGYLSIIQLLGGTIYR